MKQLQLTALLLLCGFALHAQVMNSLPASGGNLKSSISQRIGITDMKISWDAPAVKGREGKIWGTAVAHYGFQNLGFGTAKESPWRAGSNENTAIYFSTDVTVEGKPLAAGKYGFFIALYPDSCTLIFSKTSTAWGSYFYNPAEDALRVTVRQQKDLPQSRERLAYEFSDQTENSTVIALVWERWRIPFRVAVDLNKTVVEALRKELQNSPGFYEQNLNGAANFCLQHNTNLEEALTWADNAINMAPTFNNYQLKSRILNKLDRSAEAEKVLTAALDKASVQELHQYGRQLITDKKPAKAMEVFQLNYKKNGDTWPTHVGLMRGYSANGDLKKALEHAQIAAKQAPDDLNRKNLEGYVKALSEGKAIVQ
ncbi:MAG: DUF2911 domain-containing protein [Haliscomenobacteraceae bacterium CHB4]|nr:hypothetical protein [Saprospiraceae bacterium]MCE7921823.1 DUF2911 domain-containing protein [Haliscomenobacteraceae bacterium CHB4]